MEPGVLPIAHAPFSPAPMRSGDAGPSVVVTWAVCSRGGARGSLSLSLLRRALHPSPSSPSGQGGPRRRRCAMPLVRYRKVVILGYRSVGKTSLAHQFIDGEFLDCYDPTVESTYNKMLMVGKDEFHLQLVDTAGQDEYTILPHSFTIGIHGYVLVYSVTSLKSFQVVKSLHSKLYESRGKTRMPVVLVGNKADLSLESRQVKTDEGRKLADSWGAVFLESSAKENQLTQGIFTKVIEEIDRVDNSCGEHRSCILM